MALSKNRPEKENSDLTKKLRKGQTLYCIQVQGANDPSFPNEQKKNTNGHSIELLSQNDDRRADRPKSVLNSETDPGS